MATPAVTFIESAAVGGNSAAVARGRGLMSVGGTFDHYPASASDPNSITRVIVSPFCARQPLDKAARCFTDTDQAVPSSRVAVVHAWQHDREIVHERTQVV